MNYNKNIYTSIIALTIAILFHSCKEVGPNIDLGKNKKTGLILDTAYSEPIQNAEPKNILIEEFTGIRCLNCPQAHAMLKYIIGQNPGRVFGASMHSYLQDEPYPSTKVDLRSPIAQKLEDVFIYPGYKPNGAVDRHNFTGNSLCNDYLEWTNYVTQRLGVSTPVNLSFQKSFTASSSELFLDVKMHFTQTETEPCRLTIFLLEDSIITAQLQPNNTIDTNYVHNEVVRGVITDTLGDKLNFDLTAGTTVRHVYKTSLASSPIKFEHGKILLLVHRYGTSKEILQVKEIELLD